MIRKQRAGDELGIAKILHMMHQSLNISISDADLKRINANNVFFLAELADQPGEFVGCSAIRLGDKGRFYLEEGIPFPKIAELCKIRDIKREECVEGNTLFVAKEYRKYHLGAVLQLITILEAKNMGYQYMVGLNHGVGIELARGFGFEVIAENVRIDNGTTTPFSLVFSPIESSMDNSTSCRTFQQIIKGYPAVISFELGLSRLIENWFSSHHCTLQSKL